MVNGSSTLKIRIHWSKTLRVAIIGKIPTCKNLVQLDYFESVEAIRWITF